MPTSSRATTNDVVEREGVEAKAPTRFNTGVEILEIPIFLKQGRNFALPLH